MEAPFEFEVERYDEVEGKTEILHGVLFAEDYVEAAKKVEGYFEQELITMKLFANEESPVYIFEDTQNEAFHGLYKVVDFKEWVTR